jgi:hypothetical protein
LIQKALESVMERGVAFLQWWNAVFDKPDSYVALFNLLLFISTMALWISTHRLFRITRDALEHDRKVFNSTHRPKFILRQFTLEAVEAAGSVTLFRGGRRLSLVAGSPIIIKVAIVNVGDTVGQFKNAALQIFEPPGIDTLQKPINVKPLESGQRAEITISSEFNVTSEQLAAIGGGRLAIQVLGEITYIDLLGIQRRTGFRRSRNPLTGKFDASPSAEEEYQD